jgi:DNA polymerase-3 subunit gamma/tau
VAAKSAPIPVVTSPAAAVVQNSGAPVAKWSEVVTQLGLAGLVRELANNTTLESSDNGAMVLVLEEVHGKLLNKEREAELKQALEKYYGNPVKLTLRIGRPGETPRRRNPFAGQRQQAAVQAITASWVTM